MKGHLVCLSYLLIIALAGQLLNTSDNSDTKENGLMYYESFNESTGELVSSHFELKSKHEITTNEAMLTLVGKYNMFPNSTEKPFSDEEKKMIKDYHNQYRSNLSTAVGDMQYMSWDEDLAKLAQTNVKLCGFDNDPDFLKTKMGKTVYYGPSSDPGAALRSWHGEHVHMDFYKWLCAKTGACFNIMQLYWAESNTLGCERHLCKSRTHMHFILCYYKSRYYVDGKSGITIGTPCSRCKPNRGGFCYQNLCITKEICKKEKLKSCICNLSCKNCGTLNTTQCTCACLDGWDGLDCSARCENFHRWCDIEEEPTLEDKMHCEQQDVIKYVTCRKMCDMCRDTPFTMDDKLCCGGSRCEEGYVLNIRSCRCELLCPSIACDPSGAERNVWFPSLFSYDYRLEQLLAIIPWLFLYLN